MRKLVKKTKNGFDICQVSDDYQFQNEFETFDNHDNLVKPDIQNNVFIETATPEEIAEFQKNQFQNQIIEYKSKWLTDGQNYYADMQNRIIFMLIGKTNAVALMTEIKKTINPMLEQIQRGNHSLAMLDYLDGENNPTISEVVELFNEIGQYCLNYYQTEYPH